MRLRSLPPAAVLCALALVGTACENTGAGIEEDLEENVEDLDDAVNDDT